MQSNINGGAFPYGPRSLKIDTGDMPTVQKRKKKRSVEVLSRNVRSAELGVNSAYEVVSEVDLDFVPNEEEERKRITIFQVTKEKYYFVLQSNLVYYLPKSWYSKL